MELSHSGQGILEAHYGFETEAPGILRRRIYVYQNRFDRRRKLPLVIALDGQHLFEATAPMVSWRAESTCDNRKRPFLLVGFPSSTQRYPEYIGWSKKEGHTYPAAQAFRYYLVEQLLPYLAEYYRIDHDRVYLMGASAGGVAALYSAWRHPEVFDAVACLSAGRHYYLELLRTFKEPPPFRLYLSCGDRGMDRGFRPQTRNFARALTKRGAKVRLRLHSGDHSERTWARRLPGVLDFFLGPESR